MIQDQWGKRHFSTSCAVNTSTLSSLLNIQLLFRAITTLEAPYVFQEPTSSHAFKFRFCAFVKVKKKQTF